MARLTMKIEWRGLRSVANPYERLAWLVLAQAVDDLRRGPVDELVDAGFWLAGEGRSWLQLLGIEIPADVPISSFLEGF